MKIQEHDAGHMTKMATTLIYGKYAFKLFFSWTGRLISIVFSIVDSSPS